MQALELNGVGGNREVALAATVGADNEPEGQQRAAASLPRSLRTVGTVAGAVAVVVLVGWVGHRTWVWLQDRQGVIVRVDAPLELPRFITRLLRPSLRVLDMLGAGFGPGERQFLPPAPAVARRNNRLEGLMVMRLETILVFPVAAGIYVYAVLDPFADGLELRMTQEMADNLGTGQGALLTYRIARHVFAANVIVEEAPDQARALQLAQQQATAANQHLTQDELARRAEAIMAERQRRVVVPAGALQQLLRAGVSIIMQ